MQNSDANVSINFWIVGVFFAIVLGGSSLGILFMTRANSIVKTKIAENKEAARPARIDAITIQDKSCADCFDVAPMLKNFSKTNVVLSSHRAIERNDEEAKTLIAKYKIDKLPTIILRGEVQKNADLKTSLSRVGSIDGDTFVLRQIGGPYVSVATGEIKGRTELALITDSSCGTCYDVKKHQAILSQFGLNSKTKIIDINTPEAKTLLEIYKIFLVPTFVLTGDVKEYQGLLKVWPQVGVVKNNSYIFDKGVASMGVYKDLKTGKIIDPSAQTKSGVATPKK
ncbi:MAG: hypothetical protein HY981_04425 [Candidatus Magasanikbacteria bacterium]|nr:hypothetical protein [Candidatus Magasanikbacteria bacterium]